MTSWTPNDVIYPALISLAAITLHYHHDISSSAHCAFLHTDTQTIKGECVCGTKEHILSPAPKSVNLKKNLNHLVTMSGLQV